jgi:hypothetical protein
MLSGIRPFRTLTIDKFHHVVSLMDEVSVHIFFQFASINRVQ